MFVKDQEKKELREFKMNIQLKQNSDQTTEVFSFPSNVFDHLHPNHQNQNQIKIHDHEKNGRGKKVFVIK